MKIVKVLYPSAFRAFTIALMLGTGAAAQAAPYVPPTGIGAPARRESAGTRGCVFGTPANLVALMPAENVGLTTAAYPRFYWYLPVNQASFVEFTLTTAPTATAAATVVYQTRFAVTGEAGIMSLQLPETASLPPLAPGDRYRWQLAVFCNPASPNGDLQVDGWVERQLPDADLMAALATASEREQAELYASNGYWFDAVESFATQQIACPEDADWAAGWTELLTSVGLGHLAMQPWVTGE